MADKNTKNPQVDLRGAFGDDKDQEHDSATLDLRGAAKEKMTGDGGMAPLDLRGQEPEEESRGPARPAGATLDLSDMHRPDDYEPVEEEAPPAPPPAGRERAPAAGVLDLHGEFPEDTVDETPAEPAADEDPAKARHRREFEARLRRIEQETAEKEEDEQAQAPAGAGPAAGEAGKPPAGPGQPPDPGRTGEKPKVRIRVTKPKPGALHRFVENEEDQIRGRIADLSERLHELQERKGGQAPPNLPLHHEDGRAKEKAAPPRAARTEPVRITAEDIAKPKKKIAKGALNLKEESSPAPERHIRVEEYREPPPPKPKKEELAFPDGFLWGTATSAYQIEGGIINDWSLWENSGRRKLKLYKQGRKIEDYVAGQACDSYNRYEEDFDLAREMNNNAIRFSLEWARIQPEKDTWNVGAIEHYRRVLRAAKERGLVTVVTLWHWTMPAWLSHMKGWENRELIDYFSKYAEVVIEELGADIDYWIVMNEPTVPAIKGYITRKFPPQKFNPYLAWKVLRNLAAAYKLVYSQIHRYYPKAQVSLSNLINDFEPARPKFFIEWSLAKLFHYLKNAWLLNQVERELDFIGLNYYFHYRIVWYPPFKRNKNEAISDMGWEIYPEGIYNVLKFLQKYNKPILITENGLADALDKQRPGFILDHLMWVHRAIEEGVPVYGYFHWSLIDNFEWDKGWIPKFGLYEVDRETFERTPRPSAKIYADICRKNRIEI